MHIDNTGWHCSITHPRQRFGTCSYLTDPAFDRRDSDIITKFPNLKHLTVEVLQSTKSTIAPRNVSVQHLRVTERLGGPHASDFVDLNVSFKSLTHLTIQLMTITKPITYLSLISIEIHMGVFWTCSDTVFQRNSAAGHFDPYLLAYSPPSPPTGWTHHNTAARNLKVVSGLDRLEVELYHIPEFKADHAFVSDYDPVSSSVY